RSCVTTSQSLTAISWPSRPRSDSSGPISIMEPATLRDESFEKRGRLPVITEPGAILVDAGGHGGESDRAGVERGAAAGARKTKAVGVDDVDASGPQRVAFFENPRPLVGESRGDPRENLIVAHAAPRDAAPFRRVRRELLDERIRDARTAAGLVAVPSGAR